jgi:hypothetical protein
MKRFVPIAISVVVTSVVAACGSSPKPVVVETTPVPTASSPPRQAASPVAEVPTAPAPPLTSDACAAPCRGRVGDELVAALSFRAKQAHRCYDRALAADATLQGRVLVRVRIGADGRVCRAVGEAEGPMRAVADCTTGYFSGSGSVPRPAGGCVDVDVPIAFLPRQDDAGAP